MRYRSFEGKSSIQIILRTPGICCTYGVDSDDVSWSGLNVAASHQDYTIISFGGEGLSDLTRVACQSPTNSSHLRPFNSDKPAWLYIRKVQKLTIKVSSNPNLYMYL